MSIRKIIEDNVPVAHTPEQLRCSQQASSVAKLHHGGTVRSVAGRRTHGYLKPVRHSFGVLLFRIFYFMLKVTVPSQTEISSTKASFQASGYTPLLLRQIYIGRNQTFQYESSKFGR